MGPVRNMGRKDSVADMVWVGISAGKTNVGESEMLASADARICGNEHGRTRQSETVLAYGVALKPHIVFLALSCEKC
jgi:hypothetical protein